MQPDHFKLLPLHLHFSIWSSYWSQYPHCEGHKAVNGLIQYVLPQGLEVWSLSYRAEWAVLLPIRQQGNCGGKLWLWTPTVHTQCGEKCLETEHSLRQKLQPAPRQKRWFTEFLHTWLVKARRASGWVWAKTKPGSKLKQKHLNSPVKMMKSWWVIWTNEHI